MEKSALPFSRSLRKVEASALLAKCWLASPRGFAPKRLFNNPRDPGNSRSAQFNLSTIPQKAAHHGKCTLGAEQLGARKKGV
jgi:hypothetical protein